jgi:type IV secretory pathway TrbF-like protein
VLQLRDTKTGRRKGTDIGANPYAQGWREWDERYADLVLGKRNWQITAAGLMVITLVLAFGMVWLSTRSKFVPYVVEAVEKRWDADRQAIGLSLNPRRPYTKPPQVLVRHPSAFACDSWVARTAMVRLPHVIPCAESQEA